MHKAFIHRSFSLEAYGAASLPHLTIINAQLDRRLPYDRCGITLLYGDSKIHMSTRNMHRSSALFKRMAWTLHVCHGCTGGLAWLKAIDRLT
jgi:hypothetical protein